MGKREAMLIVFCLCIIIGIVCDTCGWTRGWVEGYASGLAAGNTSCVDNNLEQKVDK